MKDQAIQSCKDVGKEFDGMHFDQLKYKDLSESKQWLVRMNFHVPQFK